MLQSIAVDKLLVEPLLVPSVQKFSREYEVGIAKAVVTAEADQDHQADIPIAESRLLSDWLQLVLLPRLL